MKFRVASEIKYDVHSPSTIILNIHALRTPTQTVLEETFHIEPYVKTKELTSANGENRLVQLETLENKHLHISYQAVVDTSHTLLDSHQLSDIPVMQLDESVIPYLFAAHCLFRPAILTRPFNEASRVGSKTSHWLPIKASKHA